MRYIFFFLMMYCISAVAQEVDQKQKTIALFDSVLTKVPREKIYVHFDKSVYLPTDTIWFKAYLVNSSFHIPSEMSKLIYTELINDKGQVIQSLSLPTTFGLSSGSFAFHSDNIKPGSYTFRAYTNWMQNFGVNHFFIKKLKIIPLNTSLSSIEKKTPSTIVNTRQIDSLKRKNSDIDIQFLPEGGSWLENRRQKMSFKALNIIGKGIVIKGEIIDSKKNKVTSFISNDKGMGYFSMLPLPNETYQANISYNGISKTISLPKAKTDGTSLKVENLYANDSITVIVNSTSINREFTIIGQSRGILCFVVNKKFNETKTIAFKIPKSTFLTGVCQVILLDEKNKITNERNFFINHNDNLKLDVIGTDKSYHVRDSIPIQIKVANIGQQPKAGSFSIAVTDDHQVLKDSINDTNILSYFLMTSDLKGEIESPGYYFYQPDAKKHNDLEALMLTQGWVSYDWNLSKKPMFKVEKQYTISGKVTNLLNKPMAKAKITLLGSNKGFMLLDTITNENGEFIFNKLPMLDSASFVIQAKSQKGKVGGAGIIMNEFTPPLVSPTLLNKPLFEEILLDSVSKNLISAKVEEYKLTFKEGLLLNEVNIIGKRTIKGSKNFNGSGEADQIITDGDLLPIPKKTLYNILVEKVKDFREGSIRRSGEMTFYVGANILKFYIDGVEVDFFYHPEDYNTPNSYYYYIRSYLDNYLAEDIKGIEVMSSQQFSKAYKNRFLKNQLGDTEYTIIEITTKTGHGPFLKKSANIYIYKPMNYGSNRVFYSPKYTSDNKNDKKPDFRSTVYWNPNVLTNEKGEASFSFFSADKPGNYTIWIEGTDLQGNFGFKSLRLKIK